MTSLKFHPQQVAVMHIDVERAYAVEFGDHHKQIKKFVNKARDAGCRIIGINYDPHRRCQMLPPGHRERQGWLVPVSETDYAFRKSTPSALGAAGGNDLRQHVCALHAGGVRAVLLAGYYYDQCVVGTARSLVQLDLGLAVHAVHSMCRKHTETPPFNAPVVFAEFGATVGTVINEGGMIVLERNPLPVRPDAASTMPSQAYHR